MATTSVMDNWEQFTRSGNLFYRQGKYTSAKEFYIKAANEINALIQRQGLNAPNVTCWVISYLNLSDCLKQLSQVTKSGQLLMHCHAQINALLEHNSPNDDFFEACLKAKNELCLAIANLLGQHSELSICDNCLKQVFDISLNTYNSQQSIH
jgi:hypothetical protein